MAILHFFTMTLEEKLQHSGFLKNEIKVYMAILALGKGTLTEVSEKACVNKVNSLDKLRKLTEKRLVVREKETAHIVYTALPPKQALRQYIKELKGKYDQTESLLMDSLEGLEIQYANPKDLPEVKFVYGKNKIDAMQLEVQATQFDEMYEFTNVDVALKHMTASTLLIKF